MSSSVQGTLRLTQHRMEGALGGPRGSLLEQSVYERIPKDRRKDEASCVQHPVISLSPTGHYL